MKKKTKIYLTKIYIVIIALVNHFQIVQIIQENNHLITLVTEVDHQKKEFQESSQKIDIVDQIVSIISIEITIHNQIQTEENIRLIPVPIQILGIDIDHETHHTVETETIQTIGIEVIQIIEINGFKTIDHETIHTTDLIINEQITTTTIIDHEKILKIGIQTITINKKNILNLLIEIIIATPIPNTIIEATQRNIKDKLIRYKQLKKQLQTPLVSMIQIVLTYNTIIVNQQTAKVIQIIPSQLI